MALTKQDLDAIEGLLEKKLDLKLVSVHEEIRELTNDVKALREQIQQLFLATPLRANHLRKEPPFTYLFLSNKFLSVRYDEADNIFCSGVF